MTRSSKHVAGMAGPLDAGRGGEVSRQVAKHSCHGGHIRVRVGLELTRLRLALILC
jgi:hypothetical protein